MYTEFRLSIKTGNAAFGESGLEYETARILRQAAEKVESGKVDFALLDKNGNRVGEALFE